MGLVVRDFALITLAGIRAARRSQRSRSWMSAHFKKGLVQSASAPKPASPPGLAANEPPQAAMATARPDPAPLPRSAFRRHYPRQEPSAVVPHAGICAGGRPKGRSLPQPLGLRDGWDATKTREPEHLGQKGHLRPLPDEDCRGAHCAEPHGLGPRLAVCGGVLRGELAHLGAGVVSAASVRDARCAREHPR